MMNAEEHSNRDKLRALLESESEISADLIEQLMASSDREDQAYAYHCLSNHWERIRPEMEVWFTAPFVFHHLFLHITEQSEEVDLDSETLSPYESAEEIVGLLLSWIQRPQGETVVADLINWIDHTFLTGGESIRNCIETGIFGTRIGVSRAAPALRPLDRSLRTAGRAIPGFFVVSHPNGILSVTAKTEYEMKPEAKCCWSSNGEKFRN